MGRSQVLVAVPARQLVVVHGQLPHVLGEAYRQLAERVRFACQCLGEREPCRLPAVEELHHGVSVLRNPRHRQRFTRYQRHDEWLARLFRKLQQLLLVAGEIEIATIAEFAVLSQKITNAGEDHVRVCTGDAHGIGIEIHHLGHDDFLQIRILDVAGARDLIRGVQETAALGVGQGQPVCLRQLFETLHRRDGNNLVPRIVALAQGGVGHVRPVAQHRVDVVGGGADHGDTLVLERQYTIVFQKHDGFLLDALVNRAVRAHIKGGQRLAAVEQPELEFDGEDSQHGFVQHLFRKLAVLHQRDQLLIRTGRGHEHIVARVGGDACGVPQGFGILLAYDQRTDVIPVGHHEAVKAEFVLEDIGQQFAAGGDRGCRLPDRYAVMIVAQPASTAFL